MSFLGSRDRNERNFYPKRRVYHRSEERPNYRQQSRGRSNSRGGDQEYLSGRSGSQRRGGPPHHDFHGDNYSRHQRSSSVSSVTSSASRASRRSGSYHDNGYRNDGYRGDGYHGDGYRSDGGKPLYGFKKSLTRKHNAKTLDKVQKYIDNLEQLAEMTNNYNYLRRCRQIGIIPQEYWQSNPKVRNTRDVVNLLDECSFRLMLNESNYFRLRKGQLNNELARTDGYLKDFLSPQEHHKMQELSNIHYNTCFERIRDDQRRAVEELRREMLEYEEKLRQKRKSGPKKTRRERGAGDGHNPQRRTRRGSTSDTEEEVLSS